MGGSQTSKTWIDEIQMTATERRGNLIIGQAGDCSTMARIMAEEMPQGVTGSRVDFPLRGIAGSSHTHEAGFLDADLVQH